MSPVSVLQTWVQTLSFMQQSVLICAIRGPDGVDKLHGAKALIRWYRRCVLYSAFESNKHQRPSRLLNPFALGGGSFTGPADVEEEQRRAMIKVYLDGTDSMPHHFQLHMLHAAEVVGYKHDDLEVRKWWHDFYLRLVMDMHLSPETEEQMDFRLGDSEAQWRATDVEQRPGPCCSICGESGTLFRDAPNRPWLCEVHRTTIWKTP